MEDISKLVLANQEILQISFGILLVLGLIKIFTNKILSILILGIIGINVYYFVGADDAGRKEINGYISKLKNITKEDVVKTAQVATDTVCKDGVVKSIQNQASNLNVVKSLPTELQTKLAEYGINDTKDLVDMLEKNYNDVK